MIVSSFALSLFECRPENDFVELVWGNGHISMQGQSSVARKVPACNSLQSHSFKIRDKDIGNGRNSSKVGKFGGGGCGIE